MLLYAVSIAMHCWLCRCMYCNEQLAPKEKKCARDHKVSESGTMLFKYFAILALMCQLLYMLYSLFSVFSCDATVGVEDGTSGATLYPDAELMFQILDLSPG